MDRTIFLYECWDSAEKCQGEEKNKYLTLYFRAFPRDFANYARMIYAGFLGDTLYTVYSSSCYRSNPSFYNPWSKFQFVIDLDKPEEEIPKEELSAESLKHWESLYGKETEPYKLSHQPGYCYEILEEVQAIIPDTIYYEKMISLGIGGFWEADAIEYMRLHLLGLVFQNSSLAIDILKKKTNEEITSFFYFLFDGPHPENFQQTYDELYSRLSGLDIKIANLMKKAYTYLVWIEDLMYKATAYEISERKRLESDE